MLEKKRTLMRTSLWRIFYLVAGLTVNSYDVYTESRIEAG
ncbi:hypothetical protein A6A12_1785 [Vibrio anguillarum]|nr:hypothetical protein A6A12_1785 [Vibrio anguillarum]